MMTSTTPLCRFSLVASRQHRRALGDLFAATLFLAASAASLGVLLTF